MVTFTIYFILFLKFYFIFYPIGFDHDFPSVITIVFISYITTIFTSFSSPHSSQLLPFPLKFMTSFSLVIIITIAYSHTTYWIHVILLLCICAWCWVLGIWWCQGPCPWRKFILPLLIAIIVCFSPIGGWTLSYFPPSILACQLMISFSCLFKATILLNFMGVALSYRRHYVTEDILALWLLQGFFFFCDDFGALGVGVVCVVNVSFGAVHRTITYSLHFYKFYISVIIPFCHKKMLFWWGARTTFICCIWVSV